MSQTIYTQYGLLDDAKLKKLRKSIEEMIKVMHSMEYDKKFFGEIVNDAYEETKVPKKIIKRIAKSQFKQSFGTEVSENKEFEALFETTMKVSIDDSNTD